ncbi:nitroreductase [Streptomyces marispadix]|uniref:Nitroreductase n=1 Tax=Streptomyces marispadix TaxID=2922868 RepID=A0ABS9SX06_9ACTN|nr:nitroreductase [Streptomyces marispadix]MCH6160803.1 nitroreductase [Streptomyces marispadix]
MHNAQPWRFRYSRGGDSIELRAVPERAVPHADPELRALHLGCGAALFNLRVAAQSAGFRPVVTLLPDPDDWQTLASVSLRESAGTVDSGLPLLYRAISERRTSRYPFAERPIPPALANRLVEQARSEGARLAFLSGWHLSLVLDVIEEAELSAGHGGDPDERLWVRTGVKISDAIADGVPHDGLGHREADGRAPVSDLAHGRSGLDTGTDAGAEASGAGPHTGTEVPGAGERGPDMNAGTSRPGTGPQGAVPQGAAPQGGVPGAGAGEFAQLPHLGLLCTEHDHPDDWLMAGQAMERMLLTATREGLATSFATQALERPELRWLLRDPVWGSGPVQMVVRLGYGPLDPATPRLPLRDVLEFVP